MNKNHYNQQDLMIDQLRDGYHYTASLNKALPNPRESRGFKYQK